MVGESPHARRLQSLHVTLIRHGQSLDNLTNVWAGHKDSPLTATGLAQARALAESLAQVHIDAIYASDLKRASQTAHEVLNANRTIPPPLLVQTQSLREQHFGLAEGRDWREAEWTNPNRAKGAEARKLAFPEGESLEAVNARLTTAIRRFILPRLESLRASELLSGPPPHVVIVAHGISIAEILRVLMSYHDVEATVAAPWPHPALAYKRVRLDNTGWTRLQLSVPLNQSSASEPTITPASSSTSLSTKSGAKLESDAAVLPTLPSKVHAPMSAADGGKAIQSTIEGQTTAVATEPPSLLSQLPKPPRKDIFVKFIGHQNNTDHLAGFAMSGGIGSAANILGGGSASGNDDLGSAGEQERSKDSKATGRGIVTGGSHRTDLGQAGNGRARVGQGSHGINQMPGNGREVERRHSPSSYASSGASPSSSRASPFLSTTATHDAHSRNAGRQLSFPAPPYTVQAPGASSEIWKNICSKILPLFGSEGLRTAVEEINENVSQHIRRTLDRGPARAWGALTLDLRQLLGTGLLSLENRLGPGLSPTSKDDRQLLTKLYECWTAYGQILPWVEAAFLPLSTDPVLISLVSGSSANSRGLASQTVSAPDGGHHLTSSPTSGIQSLQTPPLLRSQPADVKKLGLSVFRDALVLPHFERLLQLFPRMGEVGSCTSQGTSETHPGSLFVSSPIAASTSGRRGFVEEEATSNSRAGLITSITQMIHILRSVQSGDDAQQGIDALLRALRVGTSREKVASTTSPARKAGVATRRDVGMTMVGLTEKSGSGSASGFGGSEEQQNGSTHETNAQRRQGTTTPSSSSQGVDVDGETCIPSGDRDGLDTPCLPHLERHASPTPSLFSQPPLTPTTRRGSTSQSQTERQAPSMVLADDP